MDREHDSIRSLQRSARLTTARDEAHYRLLRIGEAVQSRATIARRLAFGAVSAAALLAVVATATAVAGRVRADDGHDGVRTAPPAPVGTRAAETIMGSPGRDRLDGRGGDDVVMSGAGVDVVSGSAGNDVLHAGAGDDVLWAGPGRDVLLGAEGDDELHAQNVDGQADRLHCGPGTDTAWVVSVNGHIEDRAFGCERVVVVEVSRVRSQH